MRKTPRAINKNRKRRNSKVEVIKTKPTTADTLTTPHKPRRHMNNALKTNFSQALPYITKRKETVQSATTGTCPKPTTVIASFRLLFSQSNKLKGFGVHF